MKEDHNDLMQPKEKRTVDWSKPIEVVYRDFENKEAAKCVDYVGPYSNQCGDFHVIIGDQGTASEHLVKVGFDGAFIDGGYDFRPYVRNVNPEQVEHVRFFNIYPERVSDAFLSRRDANDMAGNNRIGLQRVVFKEGVWYE